MKRRQSGLSLLLSFLTCRRHDSLGKTCLPSPSDSTSNINWPVTISQNSSEGALISLEAYFHKGAATFGFPGACPSRFCCSLANRLSKMGPGRHNMWEGRRRASVFKHSHDYFSKPFLLARIAKNYRRTYLQGHLVSAFISFACLFVFSLKNIDNIMVMNIERTRGSLATSWSETLQLRQRASMPLYFK